MKRFWKVEVSGGCVVHSQNKHDKKIRWFDQSHSHLHHSLLWCKNIQVNISGHLLLGISSVPPYTNIEHKWKPCISLVN